MAGVVSLPYSTLCPNFKGKGYECNKWLVFVKVCIGTGWLHLLDSWSLALTKIIDEGYKGYVEVRDL